MKISRSEYEEVRKEHTPEPYKKLMVALFIRALMDSTKKTYSSRDRDKESAIWWLLEDTYDDADEYISFGFICAYLYLDKSAIQAQLRTIIECKTDLRHSNNLLNVDNPILSIKTMTCLGPIRKYLSEET